MEGADFLECQRVCNDPNERKWKGLRAEVLLRAREGQNNAEIAKKTGINAHIVGKIRRNYVSFGLQALLDRPRSGRPRSQRTETNIQRIIQTVISAPPDGLPRWSTSSLALKLKIPKATLARALEENQLYAHRLWASTFYPSLKIRASELIGLYLHPGESAMVLQEIDLSDDLHNVRHRSYISEYSRVGPKTSVLFGDSVVPLFVKPSSSALGLLQFLENFMQTHPGQRLSVVSNASYMIRGLQGRAWMESNPSIKIHVTGSRTSWTHFLACAAEISFEHNNQTQFFKTKRDLSRFMVQILPEKYLLEGKPLNWVKTTTRAPEFKEQLSDSSKTSETEGATSKLCA
jgi:transposase